MNSTYEINKILSKFDELKKLDENNKNSSPKKIVVKGVSDLKKSSVKKKIEKDLVPTNDKKVEKQVMYTQSDIAKEVAKLKPYLEINNDFKTTEEMVEEKNKQCSQQNFKMMSDLIITENRKLCQVLEEAPKKQSKNLDTNEENEKKGWIFEVFYRILDNRTRKQVEQSREKFISGYAVMTEIVQFFTSLTFLNKITVIRPSEISLVRYLERENYEVIRVEQGQKVIEIGFLDQKTFDLFDRMLFLQKNMSKSTTTRLFQNQLIRSIYTEYSK